VRRPGLLGLAVPARVATGATALLAVACATGPIRQGVAGGAPPAATEAPETIVAQDAPAPADAGADAIEAPPDDRALVQTVEIPRSRADAGPRNDPLAVGDQVRIVVAGQTDLSTELPVPPSGRVELPGVGALELLGKTTEEVSRELRTRLDTAGFLVDPEVSVTVLRFAPRLVFVVEGVEKPEAYEIPVGSELHLTQVIALAGGLSTGADPSQVTILRRPKQGPAQRLKVDLQAILDSDRVDLDPVLMPDDAVLVRDVKQGEEQVFVTGKVRTPGSYRYSPRQGITFLQAIVLAGGLDKYARPAGAALLRRTPTGRVTLKVDLERILSGDLDKDLPLQSGDIVFVPESFF
jgi:polysaccharide export outer membrane protein